MKIKFSKKLFYIGVIVSVALSLFFGRWIFFFSGIYLAISQSEDVDSLMSYNDVAVNTLLALLVAGVLFVLYNEGLPVGLFVFQPTDSILVEWFPIPLVFFGQKKKKKKNTLS